MVDSFRLLKGPQPLVGRLVAEHEGGQGLLTDQAAAGARVQVGHVHPFVVRLDRNVMLQQGCLRELAIAAEGGSVQRVAGQCELGFVAGCFGFLEAFGLGHDGFLQWWLQWFNVQGLGSVDRVSTNFLPSYPISAKESCQRA